ncbi:hypothetical protein PG994_002130 [Apiospora phragmitis]|uniref:Uncharacterized protein n=1 Tax=Apiospora phragmitis TaxID=2905665 RepID=A0ABR1WVF7_9PEZI
MSASSQMLTVQWKPLHVRNKTISRHVRKQSVAISKQLLHELAPPTLSEIAWLTVLFFWSVFCCPVTRLAFEVIGWVLEDLIPEASDIALSTML